MSSIKDKFSSSFDYVKDTFKTATEEGSSGANGYQSFTDSLYRAGEGISTSVTTDLIGSAQSVYKTFTQDYSAEVNDLQAAGVRAAAGTTTALISAIHPESLGEDVNAIAQATSKLATDYLADKWKRIVELSNRTTPVTIKSLIQDSAAIGISFLPADKKKEYGYEDTGNVLDKFLEKLEEITAYILGVDPGNGDWSSLGESVFKDFSNYASTNESFINSAASLQSVQGFVNTLTGVMETIDVVKDILSKIEPLMPMIEILVDLGAAFLNPPAAGSATNKLTSLGQEAVFKASGLLVITLKKYVFNIEIELPTILVESLATLNLSTDYGYANVINKWKESDNDYINKIGKALDAGKLEDLYNINVEENVNKFLNKSYTQLDKWRRFQFNNASGSTERKNNYLAKGVADIMNSIANEAVTISEAIDITFDADGNMKVNGIQMSYNDMMTNVFLKYDSSINLYKEYPSSINASNGKNNVLLTVNLNETPSLDDEGIVSKSKDILNII